MLQSEIDLLSRIASVTRTGRYFDASRVVHTRDQQAVFNRLSDRGYIVFKGNLGFCLTGAAHDALYRHEEQLEHDCRRKAEYAAEKAQDYAHDDQLLHKQFKHDWRITIVGSMLSFVVGLIVEYFSHIVAIAAGLWSSLFH